ncbi:MAG: methyltransferase [Candidatus Izemoplasmatales bacterium]|nr:methyltransferase [Candidatus Izemoplasmatales bacterium]
MPHYYEPKVEAVVSNPSTVRFKIREKEYALVVDHGVFSRSGLDFGTRVLLETALKEAKGRILDLGCGYGPVGVVLADQTTADVEMVDINPRAVALARENARSLGLKVTAKESDGFARVEGLFHMILTNPPIRAGKAVYYRWFEQAPAFLRPFGSFWVVIQKKQGAPSAIKKLEEVFQEVQIMAKESGYYVLRCRNSLTN